MAEKIEELDFSQKITKNELLKVLKKEASKLHITDIMKATTFLIEDAKYMQAGYREDYINRFTKAFFSRIRDIKDDKKEYKGFINGKKLQELLEVLNQQKEDAKDKSELCFLEVARIVSIYTTFILDMPIHPVGTLFPGGFKLRFKNGVYLCPVKERQMKTPSALCRFCVSKQDKNIDV